MCCVCSLLSCQKAEAFMRLSIYILHTLHEIHWPFYLLRLCAITYVKIYETFLLVIAHMLHKLQTICWLRIQFNIYFFSLCTRNTYLFSCCGTRRQNWRRTAAESPLQSAVVFAARMLSRMSHQVCTRWGVSDMFGYR